MPSQQQQYSRIYLKLFSATRNFIYFFSLSPFIIIPISIFVKRHRYFQSLIKIFFERAIFNHSSSIFHHLSIKIRLTSYRNNTRLIKIIQTCPYHYLTLETSRHLVYSPFLPNRRHVNNIKRIDNLAQVVCRKMFPMPSGNLRHGAGDARQGSGVPRGLFYMRLMRHPAEQGRSFRAEGRPGLL